MICSRRILVSELPQMEAESLVDKLGFHFSKKVNGGGEVESLLLDEDTRTAVLLFSEEGGEDIAEQLLGSSPPPHHRGNVCVCPPVVDRLLLKEFHNIGVHKATHTVRVAPFISGQMSRLEVIDPFLLQGQFGTQEIVGSRGRSRLQPKMQTCSRTVLLRGIPDVLDQDTLQDVLAVHFQKGSNGGGEILQCLYNPLGQCTSAIFSSQGGASSA